MSERYPLSPQGVFHTIQGEGLLLGEPSVFVRLAGCPVGCPDCDTDYSVSERVPTRDIVGRIFDVQGSARWVWITGGEPLVYEIGPLVEAIRKYTTARIAVATSGIRPVQYGSHYPGGVDFVSVSPHRVDESWVLRSGDQLNVVPGLNGLKLSDFDGLDVSGFPTRWVTPMWYGAAGRESNVAECVEWVRTRPGWRLGLQAHKHWGLL